MLKEQPIVSPDRLVGAMCGFTCGKMDFVQVRKDAKAKTAGNVVRAFLQDRKSELKGYEPVASHGGLVAFRRRPSVQPPPFAHGLAPPSCSELCVCNPATGMHVSLPPGRIVDESFVLLAHGDGQFLLHVVNLELAAVARVLQIQTYTSGTGTWGAVVGTNAHLPLGSPSRFIRPTPLLLDGVAYFLGESDSESLGLHVLALPITGQRQPAPIRLPTKVLDEHTKRRFAADELLLASSMVNGKQRLTIAVVDMFTISLWTLDNDGIVEPARWTRRSFVDLWKIKVQSGCGLLSKQEGDRVALECFSESSGALLFHLYCRMLYKLGLQTGMVSLTGIYCKRDSSNMCTIEDQAMLKC